MKRLFVILLWLALSYGYVVNIFILFSGGLVAAVNLGVLLRLFGIIVWPIGSVMGYIN